MAETAQANSPADLGGVREAVCIQAAKITDSFRDKDCIEDLRVYLTRESQSSLDCATGARARYAELLHASVSVSPVPFHRGYYSVDLTYYYRILADALMGNARPVPILGLGVFSKRVVMFGGGTGAKRFDTHSVPLCAEGSAVTGHTGPEAVLEAVDPMILSAKLVDTCSCCRCDVAPGDLPDGIFCCFDGELVLSGESKRLYVTLGQFSIVRMQRETQLSVPTYEYCVPTKEMCDSTDAAEDSSPSEVFNQVEFPVGSFFPFGE